MTTSSQQLLHNSYLISGVVAFVVGLTLILGNAVLGRILAKVARKSLSIASVSRLSRAVVLAGVGSLVSALGSVLAYFLPDIRLILIAATVVPDVVLIFFAIAIFLRVPAAE